MRLDSMRTRTVLIAAALFFLSLPTAFTQDFSKLEVEPVASDFPGGEGPVWSRQGFLIFSDYSRDRLYKIAPGGTPQVYREDSHGASGNAMDREGRLSSCEYKSRRVTSPHRNGNIEVLVDKFEGKR